VTTNLTLTWAQAPITGAHKLVFSLADRTHRSLGCTNWWNFSPTQVLSPIINAHFLCTADFSSQADMLAECPFSMFVATDEIQKATTDLCREFLKLSRERIMHELQVPYHYQQPILMQRIVRVLALISTNVGSRVLPPSPSALSQLLGTSCSQFYISICVAFRSPTFSVFPHSWSRMESMKL
jgi:hypothetical protein